MKSQKYTREWLNMLYGNHPGMKWQWADIYIEGQY